MNNKVTFDDVVTGKCNKLIIDILYQNEITNIDKLKEYLKNNYPKEIEVLCQIVLVDINLIK